MAITLSSSATPVELPTVIDKYSSRPQQLLSYEQTANSVLSSPAMHLDKHSLSQQLPAQEMANFSLPLSALQLEVCASSHSDSRHTAAQQMVKQSMLENISYLQSANKSVYCSGHSLSDTVDQCFVSQKPNTTANNTTLGTPISSVCACAGDLCLSQIC